jgi:hypothetical protein
MKRRTPEILISLFFLITFLSCICADNVKTYTGARYFTLLIWIGLLGMIITLVISYIINIRK